MDTGKINSEQQQDNIKRRIEIDNTNNDDDGIEYLIDITNYAAETIETVDSATQTMNKTDLKSFTVTSDLWVVTALMSAFLFAIGNLLIGKRAYHGLLVREIQILATLVSSLTFMSCNIAYKVYTNGYYFNWQESCLRDPETSKFKYFLILVLIFDITLSFFGGWLKIIGLKYALYAGLNQGVATSLYACTPLLMTIFGYLMFNEQISRYHYIGITLMTSCILTLSVSNKAEAITHVEVNGEQVVKYSTFWPITF